MATKSAFFPFGVRPRLFNSSFNLTTVNFFQSVLDSVEGAAEVCCMFSFHAFFSSCICSSSISYCASNASTASRASLPSSSISTPSSVSAFAGAAVLLLLDVGPSSRFIVPISTPAIVSSASCWANLIEASQSSLSILSSSSSFTFSAANRASSASLASSAFTLAASSSSACNRACSATRSASACSAANRAASSSAAKRAISSTIRASSSAAALASASAFC
mmetsp:Transcript_4110/g.5921  ORF Transcript_4110/g.5921 Transcript_4110/m.5921 type:complete len:221 (+) Transcript_4110:3304-3966(+)